MSVLKSIVSLVIEETVFKVLHGRNESCLKLFISFFFLFFCILKKERYILVLSFVFYTYTIVCFVAVLHANVLCFYFSE